ncbi:MAG TPA: sialidase family protein [Anaerolineales bacterium]|nr:sialidase family protein [Anaerolineales bacterium]
MRQKVLSVLMMLVVAAMLPASALASAPGPDVRLSNDVSGGYMSAYTLATGTPYSDATLAECSRSRGRQNEPSVAVNPRDTRVIIGSSNDYCAVYNAGNDANGAPIPSGPIWLGYYRSENSGASFQSSLVPGYPGDTSPYAALAHIRTASSGDPVIAWDGDGRVFMGSESSDDPEGTKKTFGDVWVARFDNPAGSGGDTLNDGKRFLGSELVAKGASAPNLLGKFHDKTAIEADRTQSACRGNVYFAWSRFTGNAGDVSIYFSRSTDHGATWSKPANLTPNIHDVQFPDIAVTADGAVYVTFRQFQAQGNQPDAIAYAQSSNCGKTFAPPSVVTAITPSDAQDVYDSGGQARDCGDASNHCQSGYTFFRRDTQVRSTADPSDTSHKYVYMVFDGSKPGTEQSTGTTYGSLGSGVGSQSGIYFVRLDGANGSSTTPVLLDDTSVGHQTFPDISADGGKLHALWWDSRNDPCYSVTRPIGNCDDRTTVASLDVYATSSTDAGATWNPSTQVTDVTSNPNFEQFSGRTVPFAGDYLWVSSVGDFSYGVWTDWRNTVAGTDAREAAGDEDGATADVLQCRTLVSGAFTGDTCPRDGGLDQDIYGDLVP